MKSALLLCNTEQEFLINLSYRSFSEGGNFSSEEIETFQKQLDNCAQMTEQVETSILNELETLDNKRQQQSMKVTSDFEEKYSFLSAIFFLLFFF